MTSCKGQGFLELTKAQCDAACHLSLELRRVPDRSARRLRKARVSDAR